MESGRIELHSVPVQNTISEEVSIYYLDNAHLHSLAVPFRSDAPLMRQSLPILVRVAGLEPARHTATDFKSVVSAIPPHPHRSWNGASAVIYELFMWRVRFNAIAHLSVLAVRLGGKVLGISTDWTSLNLTYISYHRF